MSKTEKHERRAMRKQLYTEAKRTLSLRARMGMTPAQINQAARKMTDQAISRVVNG